MGEEMTPAEFREGITMAIYRAGSDGRHVKANAVIAYLETQPLRVCLRDDTYSKGNSSVVTVALADWLKEAKP